jgi:hypothetical protein
VQPSWLVGGTTRHNFGRWPSNDYFIKVWFQKKRFLCEFPIGSYVKLSSAVADILVGGLKIVSRSRAFPPRWPPQCSCVVIKSSFDPGERLQAPGSLWFTFIKHNRIGSVMVSMLFSSAADLGFEPWLGQTKEYEIASLHCGGHLGGKARLLDTILKEDYPMTIPSKISSNWATGSRQDGFYVNFP